MLEESERYVATQGLPTPERVLRAVVAELPDDCDAIEFLELRQATPTLYMCRVVKRYRGDATSFPVNVAAEKDVKS